MINVFFFWGGGGIQGKVNALLAFPCRRSGAKRESPPTQSCPITSSNERVGFVSLSHYLHIENVF